MKIYAVAFTWRSEYNDEEFISKDIDDIELFTSSEKATVYANKENQILVDLHNARVEEQNKTYFEKLARQEYVISIIPEDVRNDVIFRSPGLKQDFITSAEQLNSRLVVIELEVNDEV